VVQRPRLSMRFIAVAKCTVAKVTFRAIRMHNKIVQKVSGVTSVSLTSDAERGDRGVSVPGARKGQGAR